MPKLLNFSEVCKGLEEVTTSKIIDKRKFNSKGLFSEQIFGPLKNYTCQCGTYYGVYHKVGKCKTCEVDIVNSTERRKRFAKIVLPMKVVNPIFYDLITTLGPSKIKKEIDLLMKNDKSILYKDKTDDMYKVVTDTKLIPGGSEKWDKLDAIYKLVENCIDIHLKNKIGNDKYWNIAKDNIDQLLLHEILVLPPDLRPASKGLSKNSHAVDKINRYYMQILTKKETMDRTSPDIDKNKQLYYSFYIHLQNDVNELYSNILEKLAKKEGLIRGNILGKRIDFSGRGVIVPDPTLELDECCLPYIMILDLFKLQVAKKLLERGKFKLLNVAIDYVDDCIESKHPSLFKIAKFVAEGEVCLLNRQPSLHRLSMLGFKIKVSGDSVIKIHPLICAPYNADFDGDQMAVYVPVSKEAKQEIIDKFLVTKNFTNPSNGNLTTTPSQDIVLGIYMLSNNVFPHLKKEVVYKDQMISKSRKIINDCFPADFRVINKVIENKELMKILNEIKNKYDNETVKNVLNKIKMIGFKYSTMFGCTMSLSSFKIKESGKIRDNLYKSEKVSEQLSNVSSKETEKLLKDNFKYSYMIESGARGSWDQARQIVLTRGFISNFKGQILTTPIKHSLLEGLTQQEFFNSTYGCRKGLLDVALNTGASGYLSRKLIFACANLLISDDYDDCGTTDYLEVFVKSEHKAKMLIGRYFDVNGKLEKITGGNYKSIVNKKIKLRSLIYCKSERICHKCYGDVYKKLHSKFIGVLAAQSLGECNTQLILRTFHTSGVAITKNEEENVGMKQMDVIADLSSVSRMLHHVKKKNCIDLVDKLFDLYNSSKTIYHVHFEAVVSQLMWVGDHKWRMLGFKDGDKITRDQVEPNFYSIQSVPSKESWLMGLAFSNPRKHILKGILDSGNYTGVIDKILCGEKIS